MIQLSFVLLDFMTGQNNVQLQSHHEYTTHKQTNKQTHTHTIMQITNQNQVKQNIQDKMKQRNSIKLNEK